MQYVIIYDREGSVGKEIANMSLWKERPDFHLDSRILRKYPEVLESVERDKPDILILAEDEHDPMQLFLEANRKTLADIHVIVIGREKDYESVRACFLAGVADYLIRPLDTEELKNSILRVYADFGIAYVVNELEMKTEALIETVFQGGGEEHYIITNIIDQIFQDWKEDPLYCQVVSDKAKKHIYEVMSERKPWIEKFLYRSDFTYGSGFSLQTREEIEKDWLRCFSQAAAIVKKYQMIDDRLVYRIGKYVIVHVDERLSLQDVADGVFLNPSYISQVFKKVTGISFSGFMTEVKIDRAKVLLRDRKIRICDVAATVGYGNPEYFTKLFHRKTGYSPADYRRMLEEERRD